MIPTERDRLELEHLIENSEYRQRLMLADAVVEAVRAAGPWPIVLGTPEAWVCRHCAAYVDMRPSTIQHKPDCPGIAVRDALAALDARVDAGQR